MKDFIVSKLSAFFLEKAEQFDLEMVFLYGSFAGGYPKIESDIDLGILFGQRVKDLFKIHSLITDISYKLTPELKKEVNIVNINPDFDHPMLYYNIIIFGLPLYIKDNDKFLSLRLEALFQMEDFRIFGVKWQNDVSRKIMREVFYG
ncbi:MAG: nucleotidyltransferase domain-containing protein [Candidatus Omnitrophota bacterium]|nr:nucleotidyltransferase domain-containing protein [Candidatus Omnitrophota bacterium]